MIRELQLGINIPLDKMIAIEKKNATQEFPASHAPFRLNRTGVLTYADFLRLKAFFPFHNFELYPLAFF